MFKGTATHSVAGGNGERRNKVPMVRHQLSGRKRVGHACPEPLFQRIECLTSFPFSLKIQTEAAAGQN
jgi:hypothetical protein